MKREIVFDTETTGLNPLGGDRIVELGCVELINHIPTGRHFHAYFNPEREMADDAFRVHGLSDEFLRAQPRFIDRAGEFLAFIEDSVLIAHNATFDEAFINAELERCSLPKLKNEIVDTVAIARDLNPVPPALGACIGASLAFMLPISTPPNAIAYGTGYVRVTEMVRLGIVLDVVGFVVALIGLRILCPLLGMA